MRCGTFGEIDARLPLERLGTSLPTWAELKLTISGAVRLAMARGAQSAAKVRSQRVSPQLLKRAVGPMGLVVLSPSGGQPQVNPVGRPITGAPEPFRIDE